MDLHPVQSLLKQGIFKIPSYQRGYSWQTKQIQEFIDDLQESLSLNEHYTGTVTVVAKGSKTLAFEKFNIFDVVDGQQRLTTITIFIQCIYSRLKKLGTEESDLNEIFRLISYKD